MVSMSLRRKEAPEKADQRRKLPPAVRSRTRDPTSFRWHFVISGGFCCVGVGISATLHGQCEENGCSNVLEQGERSQSFHKKPWESTRTGLGNKESFSSLSALQLI